MAMVLCHEAGGDYNHKQNKYKYLSRAKIEESALNFIELCGYTYDTHKDFSGL